MSQDTIWIQHHLEDSISESNNVSCLSVVSYIGKSSVRVTDNRQAIWTDRLKANAQITVLLGPANCLVGFSQISNGWGWKRLLT